MAARAPPTPEQAAATRDIMRMIYVCVEFLGVPDPRTHRTEFDDDPLVKILKDVNIKKFNQDFIGLAEDDIRGLMVPANTATGVATYPIPLLYKRRMLIVLSMFHDMSREAKGIIDITSVPRAMYDDYRTSLYKAEPIIPWNSPKKAIYSVQADELNNWMKQVKPNRADYKEWKDENQWLKNEDRVKLSLQSSAMEHLIDPTHVPTNPELDLAQRKWLMKIFVDTQTAPMAKTILKKYSSTWDTRGAWTEIEEFYTTSMTTQFSTQRISTYLTSTRLANIDWRGTHENFIIHYKEQSRLYNELSEEIYTDGQLIGFLEAALIGIPHFSQVKINYETSRRAAGLLRNGPKLTFSEYISLLISQAQTYDAGNKTTKNPRSHNRQVNMSELVFEDDIYDDEHGTLEAAAHDTNTTLDQLEIWQNEGTRSRTRSAGPRSVRMNLKTWNLLSKADQSSWDLITDDGKNTIILYSSNRGVEGNNNKNAKKYSVNNHAIIFDDDKEKLEDVKEEDTKIEIGMHQQHNVDGDTTKTPNTLLYMATHKTKLKDVPILKTIPKKGHHHDGLDINYMLSQPSISSGATSKAKTQRIVSTHELLFTRGDIENDTSDDDTFDREEARERELKEQGMDSPSAVFFHEVNVHDTEWDDFLDEFANIAVHEDNDVVEQVVTQEPEPNELNIDQVNDVFALMGFDTIPITEHLPIEEPKAIVPEAIPKKVRTMKETNEETRKEIALHNSYASTQNMSGRFKQVPKPESMLGRIKLDADKQGHTYYNETTGQIVSSSSKKISKIPLIEDDTNIMTAEQDPQEDIDYDKDLLQALELMDKMDISVGTKNKITSTVLNKRVTTESVQPPVNADVIKPDDADTKDDSTKTSPIPEPIVTKSDSTKVPPIPESVVTNNASTKDDSIKVCTDMPVISSRLQVTDTKTGITSESNAQPPSYAEKASTPTSTPKDTQKPSETSSINSNTPPDPSKDPDLAAKLEAFKRDVESGQIFDSDQSSLSPLSLQKSSTVPDDFQVIENKPKRKNKNKGFKSRQKSSVLGAFGSVCGIGSPKGYTPHPSSSDSSPESTNQFASLHEDTEQLDTGDIPSTPQQEGGPDFHQAGSK